MPCPEQKYIIVTFAQTVLKHYYFLDLSVISIWFSGISEDHSSYIDVTREAYLFLEVTARDFTLVSLDL